MSQQNLVNWTVRSQLYLARINSPHASQHGVQYFGVVEMMVSDLLGGVVYKYSEYSCVASLVYNVLAAQCHRTQMN
jgi:hypothetical protein